MQAMGILLILVCTALAEAYPLTNGDTGRIAYGEDFVPEKFPYVVAFKSMVKGSAEFTYCTGTLISEWFVLTAAHCTEGKKKSNLMIHLGTFDGEGVSVETIYQHKSFESLERADLSLLKLNRTFSSAKEYAITDGIKDIGEEGLECTSIGFGTDEKGEAHLNGKMTQIILKSGPKSCNVGIFRKPKRFWAEFLCAKRDKHMSCQGDSGGPVICNGIQYAISSHMYNAQAYEDPKCGSEDALNIYQNIKKYKSWMEEIMGKPSKNSTDGIDSTDSTASTESTEKSKSSRQKVCTVLIVLILCINI